MEQSFSTKRETKRVVRIPVDDIIIYELTEQEINILKRGKVDTYLNFSIALISAAISFLTILLVEDITNQYVKLGFVLSTAFLFIGSIILYSLHKREKSDFDQIIEKIEKKRRGYSQEREAVEQPLKLKQLQA